MDPRPETIGRYESGLNANALSVSAAGGAFVGIMAPLLETFLAFHVPGTSLNPYDPVANIAAASRYIRSRYGNPDKTPGLISLASGAGYSGYDSGGALPPGMSVAVNGTGRPEAVLTPSQSDALVTVARQAEAGSGPGRPVIVNFNYLGTQYPTVEQKAIMQRDLAMALAGATM